MLIGQKVHMSFKPLAFNQNVHVTNKKRPINRFRPFEKPRILVVFPTPINLFWHPCSQKLPRMYNPICHNITPFCTNMAIFIEGATYEEFGWV